MKEYLAARMRLVALLIAGALATAALVTPQLVEADSAPEKIRLMADALRARDSGNLELAKEKAEELIRVAPGDENVQRLLASINRDLDRRAAPVQSADAPVYGQAPEGDLEEAIDLEADAGEMDTGEADSVLSEAVTEQAEKIEAAEVALAAADQLVELGSFTEANNVLNAASAGVTLNTATADILEAIENAKVELLLAQAIDSAEAGDLKAAEAALENYAAAGGISRQARSLARKLDSRMSDPYELGINEISPEYVAQNKITRDLIARGRAQFLNGDYDGAQRTFQEVEARDSSNSEAKLFQTRIAAILGDIHKQNYYKTREQMLTEVDQSWERPKVFAVNDGGGDDGETGGLVREKLESIVIPQVNFSGMELTRVIETLSELSVVYDPEQQGVNIIPLFDASQNNPRVNLSLRNLNLDKILQFVSSQVNFAIDVGEEAVTVTPDGGRGDVSTITEFFPISRATVIRLTGSGFSGGNTASAPVDPFAAPTVSVSAGPSGSEETELLRDFFQRAGVDFQLPGTSLVYDGEQIIVTQTRRNLERMRVILRNYNEVKMVEIEAKFLEVQQSDLEEVGFSWQVASGPNPLFDAGGLPILDENGNQAVTYDREFLTGNRTLNNAFGVATETSSIVVNGDIVAQNSPPQVSNTLDLAAAAGNLFSATGWTVNGANVDFAIRALARKAGSDLMSAPKVTVLSGKRATITVAQELRYPESYGDIDSSTGGDDDDGGGGGGGGGSVTITAGTPQDFVTRNVGVEMSVTPNVENDDTISLILEPRVTQFEGFVEYGGPSVAINDTTTTVVPAGFYQPVFSTREISTELTVFDGATVVMGGLTRDEIRTVNDKVPVLGDIPGLGRLFRSEGETRDKRNLLIFVTANLISPGGSTARQSYRSAEANALFQNPVILTPSGGANRGIPAEIEE